MRQPLMMVAAASKQLTQVTQTFTSSQTVVIPAGVSVLTTVSGKGAAGAPAGDNTVTTTARKYDRYHYIIAVRRDGGSDTSSLQYTGNGYVTGSDPTDYCDPSIATPSDPVYSSYRDCYYFYCYNETTTTGGPYPASTGASATGFGQTFPGGTGGAATITNFNNVAVTGGSSNSLVIPAGGSITINYFN